MEVTTLVLVVVMQVTAQDQVAAEEVAGILDLVVVVTVETVL
jgi:hypothetical protein